LEPVRCIVVSVGFEPLRLSSLRDTFALEGVDMKTRYIVPFPPDGTAVRRCWRRLMEMVERSPDAVMGRTEIVSSTDAEEVSTLIEGWRTSMGQVVLAPFGPKPHTLGMALSALQHNLGLYYTQPLVYDPDYSTGPGDPVAYVVKWDGVRCYERPE
jgi:hypothetical protein